MMFPLQSAFLALPLEGEANERFKEIQGRLQEWGDVVTFQNPDTPHLTLYFWKELMEIEYGQVLKQAEKIAANTQSFSIKVIHADQFNEQVLALEIGFCDALARLKKRCPWPNIRPFAPHITLARIRHPEGFVIVKKRVLKVLRDASFTIAFHRLWLYVEVKGKKQTSLRDFEFAKGATPPIGRG